MMLRISQNNAEGRVMGKENALSYMKYTSYKKCIPYPSTLPDLHFFLLRWFVEDMESLEQK